MFSIYLLILSIGNATKHVRGNWTMHRSISRLHCIDNGASRLRALECRLRFDISIPVAYLRAHKEMAEYIKSPWPPSNSSTSGNNNVSFSFFLFLLNTYIYINYFYRVEKCGCRYKTAPQSESRRRKEKKGKRDECQKYPMRSSHERTAVPFRFLPL